MPWDRAINVIYHWILSNSDKEKQNQLLMGLRSAKLRITEGEKLKRSKTNARQESPQRAPRTAMPPRPAGWGDDETNMRQHLAANAMLRAPR